MGRLIMKHCTKLTTPIYSGGKLRRSKSEKFSAFQTNEIQTKRKEKKRRNNSHFEFSVD